MKCLLLVAGFAALCLAADTTSNSSDSVNATTPSSITTQSVNLRPEDLFTANSTLDTVFPDIHSLASSNVSLPIPAYKVNTSESGMNLMETTTAKQTYIMKRRSPLLSSFLRRPSWPPSCVDRFCRRFSEEGWRECIFKKSNHQLS
ncbi:Hypothetical predicted protein [Cloeon dipterum]|uniref:Uncharacterized protein n=1 Tax=Cloeon dipterum TaxID=197152 RepID=A0A8S1BWA5_9INSE|nr:Hypothetical predicted protein [Cloeon dipterum]